MSAIGRVILDTNVVVAYFRDDPTLHKKIDQVGDVYLPLVVLGELFYGAYKSIHQARMLAEVKAFLSGCLLVQPNEQTAELYGQIKGRPLHHWKVNSSKRHLGCGSRKAA
jgi:tRNA(fMet)-specific endonuclease VapC